MSWAFPFFPGPRLFQARVRWKEHQKHLRESYQAPDSHSQEPFLLESPVVAPGKCHSAVTARRGLGNFVLFFPFQCWFSSFSSGTMGTSSLPSCLISTPSWGCWEVRLAGLDPLRAFLKDQGGTWVTVSASCRAERELLWKPFPWETPSSLNSCWTRAEALLGEDSLVAHRTVHHWELFPLKVLVLVSPVGLSGRFLRAHLPWRHSSGA